MCRYYLDIYRPLQCLLPLGGLESLALAAVELCEVVHNDGDGQGHHQHTCPGGIFSMSQIYAKLLESFNVIIDVHQDSNKLVLRDNKTKHCDKSL